MNHYTQEKTQITRWEVEKYKQAGISILVGVSIFLALGFALWKLDILHDRYSIPDAGRASEVSIWLDDVINNIETGDKNTLSYAFIENTRAFSADGAIDKEEYSTLRDSYNAIKQEESISDIQDSLTKIDARTQ